MINLLVEFFFNNLIFGEFSNSDDFEDWIKCVDEEKRRRNEIFLNEQVKKNYPTIFQSNSRHNKKGEKTTPTTGTLDENNGKWEKIRSKIKIDPNLEQKKIE